MAKRVDKQVLFALSPGEAGAEGPAAPTLLIGIPAGAWHYMRNGRTNHFDLTSIGVPIRVVLYGGRDLATCQAAIDAHNQRHGFDTVDLRDANLGIKPEGEGE